MINKVIVPKANFNFLLEFLVLYKVYDANIGKRPNMVI